METAVIAVDTGNYDLKFWNGSAEPKAIRWSGRNHSISSRGYRFRGVNRQHEASGTLTNERDYRST